MVKPGNQILVIFGASGDLTKRKLIPALFDLHKQNLLPDNFGVLGVSRTEMATEKFRDEMLNGIKKFSNGKEEEEKMIPSFLNKLFYLSINTSEEKDYILLEKYLSELNKSAGGGGNYIFYMATPPNMYETISLNIAKQNLHLQDNSGWRRIIIEKPFGYDLDSARQLNKKLKKVFKEEQIYRIDHFLGKETVQNLFTTRFSNGIFEPLWNRNFIHHVEISSVESIGVENRGGYYDGSGALRDMVQNHLLQITGLVAMEPPSSFESDSVRNEILKVFQSLRRIKTGEVGKYVIRGQYTSSVIKGEKVPGYREEKGVDPESRTETYVAVKFFIDNWRWGGVPFYIRTGKRLPTRVTEIVVHFKPTPHYLFARENVNEAANKMVIRIQPDEGILLNIGMKVPGQRYKVQNINLDFHYSDLLDVYLPTAYERLLLDCMSGDATLFARGDAVEEAWKFIAPIQQAWAEDKNSKIYGYPAGTWGPECSDELIEEGGCWRYPCRNLSSEGVYCEL